MISCTIVTLICCCMLFVTIYYDEILPTLCRHHFLAKFLSLQTLSLSQVVQEVSAKMHLGGTCGANTHAASGIIRRNTRAFPSCVGEPLFWMVLGHWGICVYIYNGSHGMSQVRFCQAHSPSVPSISCSVSCATMHCRPNDIAFFVLFCHSVYPWQ